MTLWKLRPSDFAFLYEGCKRCFHLSVVSGIQQPSRFMAKIFTPIDGSLKRHFNGRSTQEISPDLPPGKIMAGLCGVQGHRF